jgi:flagellar protein FlaG
MQQKTLLRFEMTGKIDSNLGLSGFAQEAAVPKATVPASNLADATPQASGPRALIPVDYRLVIEKSAKTGSYVYKTLNSFTGEVVSQRPAEDLFKMAASNQYSPGLIVNAKA